MSNWKFKKLENIFVYIIFFVFVEHSNVNNVINAPLCLDCLLIMSILCRLTTLLSFIKTTELLTASIVF